MLQMFTSLTHQFTRPSTCRTCRQKNVLWLANNQEQPSQPQPVARMFTKPQLLSIATAFGAKVTSDHTVQQLVKTILVQVSNIMAARSVRRSEQKQPKRPTRTSNTSSKKSKNKKRPQKPLHAFKINQTMGEINVARRAAGLPAMRC